MLLIPSSARCCLPDGASPHAYTPQLRRPLLLSSPQLGASQQARQQACNTRRECPGKRGQVSCAAAVTEAPTSKGGKKGKKGGAKDARANTSVSSGIKLENIAITFQNQEVLRNVSWDVQRGERVGLVGVNGAGKTTQLQIISGALEPDAGTISREKPDMKVAYLTQEFDVTPTNTVREEFLSAYAEQLGVVSRQVELQQELEQSSDDMDRMAKVLDELNELQSKADTLDISLIDAKIDRMMPELGFKPEDNDRLVASYSGGWQMRMCLGKILLQDPDLLLLDEPTNHLDLDALEWLEGYLKRQQLPMVVVSHDREFLDQLCTKIVETEHGVAASYPGNYTQFVAAKESRLASQWSAWEKQQKEIQRQQDIIQRLSAGGSSGRATSAQKALEKLQSDEERIEKPFVAKQRRFTFPSAEHLGQSVLSVKDLTHGYQDRRLFDHANMELEKGERVAIMGPNGCGKSTLLRLVMGREQPISGQVSLGAHAVVPNYFEQNQAEALRGDLSVVQTLVEAAPDAATNDVKALLGRMMFSGLAMDKKVEVLSGGEKARLAMAKFMLTQGTLLVLDEPTNHLDIPSKEMLEEALLAFEGSVIAVTHDRYFLRRTMTRIVTVEDSQLKDYQGDYEEYLRKNSAEALIMSDKAAKARELQKSQIKSKSKMSKAEKQQQKKQKAKTFANNQQKGKAKKNAGRWA